MDIGSGCGASAIAASILGARHTLASDTDKGTVLIKIFANFSLRWTFKLNRSTNLNTLI